MNLKEMSVEDLMEFRRLIKQELNYRHVQGLTEPRPTRHGAEIYAALPVRIRGMVAEVAALHGVRPMDVCSQTRTDILSRCRWVIWATLRAEGKSLPKIGHLFDRDHTTVLSGLRRFKELQPALGVAA